MWDLMILVLQQSIKTKPSLQFSFPKVPFQEVDILCSFAGCLHFPWQHDRHAITEAGPEHCYACHSHQEKMIC